MNKLSRKGVFFENKKCTWFYSIMSKMADQTAMMDFWKGQNQVFSVQITAASTHEWKNFNLFVIIHSFRFQYDQGTPKYIIEISTLSPFITLITPPKGQ